MKKYFESISYNDAKREYGYLKENPRKRDALANAQINGDTITILPDSNNRALVIKSGDVVYLQSYDTLILSVNTKTGDIVKMWHDYTTTTLKHINTFFASYNGRKFNKKSWLAFKGV